jgi:hypothetical protein
MNADLISGGPIKHFAGAWAKFPFVGSRAHYWHEITDDWRSIITDAPEGQRVFESACKVLGATTPRVPALEMGNWPKCKRCEAALKESA